MDAPSEWCGILAIGSLAYTLTDMLSFQRKLKNLKIIHLSLDLQPCVALRMCTVSVKGGVYKWLMIFELYCLWNYIPSICVPEAKCWMSGCLLPFNISAFKNYRRSICSQIWVEFFFIPFGYLFSIYPYFFPQKECCSCLFWVDDMT